MGGCRARGGAATTVEPRERGRWIEVRKHRFGASVSGRHELDLGGGAPPQVFPEPHAWVARDLREVLERYGWAYRHRAGIQALVWDPPAVELQEAQLEGAFVVITGRSGGVARSLAYRLRPADGEVSVLLFELDPLALREDVAHREHHQVCHVPTMHGAARALRTLVEQLVGSFDAIHNRPSVGRVLVGDLETVRASPDALAWVEAVRVFVSLVVASRWGIPVIAYTSSSERLSTEGPSLLSTYADLTITETSVTQAIAVQRWRRVPHWFNWSAPITSPALALDPLPGAPGRRVGR
jgi:hypothetical protein